MLMAGVGACSPLETFNAIVPKDAGVASVGRDLAFGTDPRQKLDLYRPAASATGKPLPIIIFLYGGSWNSGDKGGYAFAGRALASRGFLVAVPDYRLVPQVRYPTFLEDNAAAVRWVAAEAARYGGDPSRIVLVGHSAGAYNAAMLALDPRWLGADRTRIRGFAGLAGPYDFLPFEGPVTRAAFGREPDPASTQPIRFASRDDPPSLLLHGTGDTTVLPRNSQRLAERLNAAGATAELRLYPGVGHVGMVTGLARPFRGRAPVLADVATFASRVTASP
ncbi:alpha/beta hydrolase [Sphingomonas swuensis]|uniref:Alpha/beta hydrolase n=1 Tax=Sphingomonas swuensis TaxID=977800 RepID=A0ABP7TE93_9SPHN